MLTHADMSPEQIAKKLGRSVALVEKFLKEHVNVKSVAKVLPEDDVEKITIREELKGSEQWMILKKEFSGDELRYFEAGYTRLISQYRSDVLPAEETQIFQAIKFEILMSRNLQARSKALDDIARLEKMQENFLAPLMGDPALMSNQDKALALTMEQQIATSRVAEQSRTTEYVKLQERHEALMKSLKSTRDQRIKDITSSKTSFPDLLKTLAERDVQKREGRRMELMKKAAERSFLDLGKEVQYEDGVFDRPILTSETVDLEDEE